MAGVGMGRCVRGGHRLAAWMGRASLHVAGEPSPLSALVRALLTFAALAIAGLSLEVWVLRHREVLSLLQGPVEDLAPVMPLIALIVAILALYLATRPKRAFQRILV